MSEPITEETIKIDDGVKTSAATNGDTHEKPLSTNDYVISGKHQAAVETETVEAEAEPDAKKRKKLPFYIAGGVLLAAAVAGSIYWLYTRQFEYTDDAFIDGEIVRISPKISAYVAKVFVKENQFVKKGDLLLELNVEDLQARLEFAKSQLSAARAQHERAQAQTDLTRVTAGASQLEARSNLRTARSNVQQTGMIAEAKRNEVKQAQLAVKTARAKFGEAQARVPRAESNLRLAQIEYDRSLDLFNFGSVSRQSLDHAENALQAAKAELASAKNQAAASESLIEEAEAGVVVAENNYKRSVAEIDSSRSEVDESLGRLRGADSAPEKIAVDESGVGTAQAGIEQAEAAVRSAELELSYAQIFAPEDGFVTGKNVQEGQLVEPGVALMAISQPGVWIVANFKETQLERMRIGQPVDIKVDAFPGRVFQGRIESFQAGTGSAFSVLPSQNASGNFVKVVQRVPVKIVFDEKPDDVHLLVPGMSVQPRVHVL
ncbi:MAG: HlyD family secretion protein [Pyrinomonadaceae bacterium]